MYRSPLSAHWMKHTLAIVILFVFCRSAIAAPIDFLGSGDSNDQQADQPEAKTDSADHDLASVKLPPIDVHTSAGSFIWVAGRYSHLPKDAFIASSIHGYPGYLCQARYLAGDDMNANYSPTHASILDPGVLMPDGCLISYAGRSHLISSYKVLAVAAGAGGAWVALGPGQVPDAYAAQAVRGGREGDKNVYICRVPIDDEYHDQYLLGKAVGGTCYIAAGNAEINWPTSDYQILLKAEPVHAQPESPAASQ